MPHPPSLPEILRGTRRRGSGPPIIFLHNGFYASRTWDTVLPFFEDRFTCVTWDRDGYGLRAHVDEIPPRASVEDGVAELEILVAHLDDIPVHLVGHCMGGAIALQFAARHPDRVGRLVLEATGFYTDENVLMKIDLMRMPWEALSPGFRARMEQMHGTAGAPVTWAHIVGHRESYIMDDAYDIRAMLPSVAVPCLLLAGGRDFYFSPEHARAGAEGIPGAEFCFLEKAVHDIHEEHPRDFIQRVLPFLDA